MTNQEFSPQKEQLDLLNKLINNILSQEGDESTRKIFFFIKRILRQFRLDSQLQESEILIDAYLRIREKIKSGESIKNISAYLNRVSYNIVREHSKKQKRSEKLHGRLLDNGYGHPDIILGGDSSNYDKITILLESLKKLKNEDLEILQLHIVEGLSWEEIRGYFSSCKGKKLSNSALRKQGERALRRLREAYTSVKKVYFL